MSDANTLLLQQAPIRKVTVFRNGATVQREITVNLPEGAHALQLESFYLDPATVRVSIAGEAVIKSVRLQREKGGRVVSGYSSMDIGALKKQQKELERDILFTQNATRFWDQYLISRTQALKSSDDASLSALSKLLKAHDAECRKMDKETFGKKKDAKLLKERIAGIQRHLDVTEASGDANSRQSVFVDILVQKCVPAKLVIEYSIRSAKWVPQYVFKLPPGSANAQRIQVTCHASVSQCTFEDWTNVQLSVNTGPLSDNAHQADDLNSSSASTNMSQIDSSATLAAKTSAPENDNSRRDPKPKIWRNILNSSNSADGSVFYDDLAQHETSESSSLASTQPRPPRTSGHASRKKSTSKEEKGVTKECVDNHKVYPMAFAAKVSVCVTGNGNSTEVEVASFDMQVDQSHCSVVNASPYVYTAISGSNDSGYPLLPGPATFSVNGHHYKKDLDQFIAPLECFWFVLGENPAMRVICDPPEKFAQDYDRIGRPQHHVKHSFSIHNDGNLPVTMEAYWTIGGEHTQNVTTSFVDAPSSAPSPGESKVLKKGAPNCRNQVEWRINIPPKKAHKATLVLKVESEMNIRTPRFPIFPPTEHSRKIVSTQPIQSPNVPVATERKLKPEVAQRRTVKDAGISAKS